MTQPTTGWPPGLMQDDSKPLSRWLAGRLNARRAVREVCAEMVAAAVIHDHRTGEVRLVPVLAIDIDPEAAHANA